MSLNISPTNTQTPCTKIKYCIKGAADWSLILGKVAIAGTAAYCSTTAIIQALRMEEISVVDIDADTPEGIITQGIFINIAAVFMGLAAILSGIKKCRGN
jgi:hypothetical protein